MNKLAARGAALLIGLVFSVSAVAQAMTKDQYNVRQTGISAEYKLAKAACDSFSGNAKDLCLAEASGKEKVATAELNARVAPSEAASYNVRLARADANYALTQKKCDDVVGNEKDVCVKQAKSVTAKANAKAHMKTAMAHDAAFEKTSKAQGVADAEAAQAQNKADQISAGARTDAAREKSAAVGTVAKDATARLGKP